jgi:predicted extracellular nuclease
VVDQDGAPDPMAANYVFSFTTAAADPCSLPFTPAYTIQGSGLTAAVTGAVTTQGVVVGDFELPGGSNQIRGFYLQDATGDGNAATSDGIFVYNGGVDTVSVGQVVRVQGTAGEFAGQTQISSPTVTPCGVSGNVSPVDVSLPFASADFPERFEGMLVRLPQTLYVTEHFQLGRFGQVVLTSRPDRLPQPTNVVAPGAPALALQAANALDRIILDDDNNLQNTDPIVFGRGGLPLSAANTLRGGDSAANITGVLVYDWAGDSASPSAYRVRPIGALARGVVNFQPANPRPAPLTLTGRLRVTSANLLNYFNSFSGCTLGVGGGATDCRGANNSAEFARQWPKTVANLVDGGADVIGVMEMENDGYGAGSAIQDLVTRLNNATAAGTYAFIDVDTLTGQTNALGVDAIKVGLIYKPAKVTPVGTTAALNSTAFVNGGDGAARNRPALAQAFEEVSSGERFIVVVNHLKSKGSACDAPDAGDGQGNCNVVRTAAANALTAWLAGNPTGTGDPDILIMGDLNAYAQEDPITAIKNAGYSNLIQDRLGLSAYSYAFDGQWGYLDHALATPALAGQVTDVVEWHTNADEPSVLDYNTEFKTPGQVASLYSADRFRSSDHDPVMVGLDLRDPLAVTLASFDAAQQGQAVRVAWETVSETGNAGFNLYRGDSAAGPQSLLGFTPSQAPGATQGASYSYEDVDVQPGQTYWYWLEDVSLGGATTLHGPVSASVQAPAAVTLGSLNASPVAGVVALPWLAVIAGAGVALALRRRR